MSTRGMVWYNTVTWFCLVVPLCQFLVDILNWVGVVNSLVMSHISRGKLLLQSRNALGNL